MDAVPAEHELSLMAELIAPELYVMEVGDPQTDVRFENDMVAFVSDPTSKPMQS